MGPRPRGSPTGLQTGKTQPLAGALLPASPSGSPSVPHQGFPLLWKVWGEDWRPALAH